MCADDPPESVHHLYTALYTPAEKESPQMDFSIVLYRQPPERPSCLSENVDRISRESRSALMRAVRGKDTKPEVRVRRVLHHMGLRFRLHRGDLPGRPDIVLPRWKLVIFVHGCFWHRHAGCKKTTTPAANHAFWQNKFEQNRKRDRRKCRQLRQCGWQ